MLLQCEEVAVIDNLSGKLYLIVYANPGEAEAYTRAKSGCVSSRTSCAIRSARRRFALAKAIRQSAALTSRTIWTPCKGQGADRRG